MIYMLMVVWFLTSFGGSFLAGFLGSFLEQMPTGSALPDPVGTVVGTAVLVMLLKPLKRTMAER